MLLKHEEIGMVKLISKYTNLSKPMRIGLVVLVLAIFGVIIVVSSKGSPSADVSKNASVNEVDTSISSQDIQSNADGLKGKVVMVSGKVFNVESQNGQTGVQIYTDPENSNGNLIILGAPTNGLKENDYIAVIGEVKGTFEGKNGFGAAISVPTIAAIKITKSDRNDVVAPAIKTKTPNQTISKGGVNLTLKKVEFAKNETRVILSINNTNEGTVSFYSFNSKLVQNGSQIKDKSIYEDSQQYDIPSDIVAGTTESGTLFFQKADPNLPLNLHFEAADSNYDTLNFDLQI